jgi:hypothetical protein
LPGLYKKLSNQRLWRKNMSVKEAASSDSCFSEHLYKVSQRKTLKHAAAVKERTIARAAAAKAKGAAASVLCSVYERKPIDSFIPSKKQITRESKHQESPKHKKSAAAIERTIDRAAAAKERTIARAAAAKAKAS